MKELGKETRQVRRRGVDAAPWRAQLPPVRTVPVPILRRWIAAAGFRRGMFRLAANHVLDLESPKPHRRVAHPQRPEDRAFHQFANRHAADLLRDLRGKKNSHARVLVSRAGRKAET